MPLNTVVTISGGYGEGDPPVPIPNTEVKPFSADGTWLDTARKSRSPPDSMKSIQEIGCSFFEYFPSSLAAAGALRAVDNRPYIRRELQYNTIDFSY